MLIAGAIVCPDTFSPQEEHGFETVLQTFHKSAVDPVIVVGPQNYVCHPSIKNRYVRFGAFGPFLTALMWTKATPVVTMPCRTSPVVVERFAAQLCNDDFALAQQTCDAKLPLVANRNGDVAHVKLDTDGLQKIRTSPMLWPPNFGLLLRRYLIDKAF